MNNCFLSIIIPIYNVEFDGFAKCIDSIRKITIPFEIIIVDDGSKEEFVVPCIRYIEGIKNVSWIRKNNGGVSSARNEGILNASGKYLFFLDADDMVTKDFVEFINNNYSTITGDWILFDIEMKYVCRKKKSVRRLFDKDNQWKIKEGKLIELDYSDVLKVRVTTTDLNESCGKLIKREILVNNEIKFPVGVISGEDAIFNTRLMCVINNIQYTRIVGYVYNYLPKSDKRISINLYRYYQHFFSGKFELIDLIYKRAEDRVKPFYILSQKKTVINSLVKDCFVLVKTKKFNDDVKKTMLNVIEKYRVFDGYQIYNCITVKDKIYYIVLKYRIWPFIYSVGLIKRFLNKE